MKRVLSIYSVFAFTIFGFSQSNVTVIQNYLSQHAKEFSIQPSDVSEIEITASASSKAPGVQHLYVRQMVNGIPVVNGLATVTLKNNQVIHVASRLASFTTKETLLPKLTAKDAVLNAERLLGLTTNVPIVISENSLLNAVVFDKGTVSKEPIPARLMLRVKDGVPSYVWEISIFPVGSSNWWSLQVSAATGEILFKNDWIQHCSFDACENESHAHQLKVSAPFAPPPPPGLDQYTVYALPLVSPNHGDRTTLVNPSDPAFSPFGWHDDNGAAGDEYTITRGNNVFASDDINDDDIPGYSPDGGPSLNFDFAYDSAVGVVGNLDAVVTNLFYMNNMMHDIWAYYGFDEESGNFQALNYTGSGIGNDFVFADAQDGSGTNNANFGTPPDGDNPRMQMFLWTSSNVPDLLTINAPASIAQSYSASTAGFGPPVPTIPLTQDLVLVIDGGVDSTDGCELITNAAALNGKIALVRRGNCTFAAKVEACEAAGAVAVIVMNNVAATPISMGGNSNTQIPSIMVSQADGNLFIATLNNEVVNGTIVNPGDLTATDSDFDNLVISHEYGHGISNRLTGGAANTNCLGNAEQMGEGWSDWLGLMITMEPGQDGTESRGVGTYVTNQPNTGVGIRPAPYSTDFAINDYTYANTNSGVSQPHGIGFVWATMLWDLNWALIDQYGFDPNVKTGIGGNNIAMQLVIEGMKLQPCEPGFVDGRDAILAADDLLYNGANKCLIWEVFAKRGLGFSAEQGSTDSRSDQVEAFDIDPACLSNAGVSSNGLGEVKLYPNPVEDMLTIDLSSIKTDVTVRITDITGKIVFEQRVTQEKELNVRLNELVAGLYLVRISSESGERVQRLVKQ